MKILYNKLVFAFAICLFISPVLIAQLQGNNWYFGNRAAITFNTDPPTSIAGSVMNAWEGVATISDDTGQLLFYTNGINIWDQNNVQMPNGFGLNGDPSSAQSGVIVPKPGDPNIYYVFSVPAGGGSLLNNARLYYSTVDMTLNGGLGDVVAGQKNINISPSYRVQEKVAAILHCNGTDVWILAHEYGSNRFLVYLIDDTNPPTLVTTQQIGENWAGNTNASIGILKASADGSRIAETSNSNDKAQVLDFNNATGELSNPITLNNIGWSYGVEFSPNTNILYVNSWYHFTPSKLIYQYDLTAANINASRVDISTAANVGAMQLGPDGQIYVARNTDDGGGANNGRAHLGIISNPNNYNGTPGACGWVEQGLFLGGNETTPANGQLSRYGLPNFIQSYFQEEADFSYVDTCVNDLTLFTPNIPFAYDSLRWVFGTEGMSTQNSPGFSFTSTGSHVVHLIIHQPCKTDTVTHTLQIVSSLIENFTGPTDVCQNTTHTYSIDNIPGNTIDWDITGGTLDSGNGTNSVSITWGGIGTGTIEIGLTPSSGCSQANFSVNITNEVNPSFDPIPAICQGDTPPFLANTSTNGITGTWDGVISSASIGQYTFTFTPDPNQCAAEITLNVEVVDCSNCIPPVITTTELYLCGGTGTLNLEDGILSSITNLTLTFHLSQLDAESNQNTIGSSVTQSGTYYVRVEDESDPTCYSVGTIEVTIEQPGTASITPLDSLCLNNGLIQLEASPTGGTWSGNGILDANSGIFSPSLAGEGTWTITYTPSGNCILENEIDITILPIPTAVITGGSVVIEPNEEAVLEADSAFAYQWNSTSNIDCANCQDIITSPETTSAYELIVYNEYGCSDTATTLIFVEIPCFPPVVPSHFSPNGDGVNDFLCVYGDCVATLVFQIFNRWGELVFETSQLDECWDGRHRNELVNSGAFVYRMEATLTNGQEVRLNGNITVVR